MARENFERREAEDKAEGMLVSGDAGGSGATSATWPSMLTGGSRRGELSCALTASLLLSSCLTQLQICLLDRHAEEAWHAYLDSSHLQWGSFYVAAFTGGSRCCCC